MLAGFKSRNHPQQVAVRGARDDTDDRRTPDSIWIPLHQEFGFTLDAAASRLNAKLPRFFDRAQDSLRQHWTGERVWCNPPYSDCLKFVGKSISEVRDNSCPLVVLLMPSNRTEQVWWQDYIEPIRDRGSGISTRFLRGRPRFGYPEGTIMPIKGDRPPFGLVVIVIEKQQSEKEEKTP